MNAIRRNRSVQIGMALLALVVMTAVLAPPTRRHGPAPDDARRTG